MPPDRSRTSNSQGRQKSCSECAKAKRKCGLEQPACRRCAKQHLACVYPRMPSSSAAGTPSQSSTLPNSLNILEGEFETHAPPSDTPPLNFNVAEVTNADNSVDDIFEYDFSTGVSSLDSLASMLETPLNETEVAVQRPFQNIGKSFTPVHLSRFMRSRIDYISDVMKDGPRTLIETNGTPWMHPLLYEDEMPQALQDAHATCALYLAKNEKNKDAVAKHISNRVQELFYSPVPSKTKDLLARGHALMLYQAMFIFGDDSTWFSRAELALPHLEDVGERLLALMYQLKDSLDPVPVYPSSAAAAAWNTFILHESIRRTVLTMYQFITISWILLGQFKACMDSLRIGSRLFVSSQLWHAESAFEFALAWNQGKYIYIKDLDFEEVMRSAQPEDLDTFAKMIMVGLHGSDDAKGWFHTRGGTF